MTTPRWATPISTPKPRTLERSRAATGRHGISGGPLIAWALVIGGLQSGRPGDTEQEHRSDCGDRDQDDEEK